MSPERSLKDQRNGGAIAMARGGVLRRVGRGARSVGIAGGARGPRRVCIRGLAGIAAIAVVALALPAPSLASGPPYFEAKSFEQEIHSTRVRMEDELRNNELTTEWQTAYSTSGPNGPWVVTHTGTLAGHLGINDRLSLLLGAEEDAAGQNLVLHLQPNTQYYARFFAKNAAGEVTEIVPFRTLAVAAPEIPEVSNGRPPNGGPSFSVFSPTPYSAKAVADVEGNGASTQYSFEYSTGLGSWTVCASGAVTVAEDSAAPAVSCPGLSPETMYFMRLIASNEKGTVEEVRPFETITAKPAIEAREGEAVRNVTASSARLTGEVVPRGSKTSWRFESAPSEGGPWTAVPGGAGTISQAQAEALPTYPSTSMSVQATLAGLSPASTYYVRLRAENECAEGCGEGVSHFLVHFQTAGPPLVSTFATHAVHGEVMRLLGSVNPGSVLTSEEQTVAIEGAPTGGTFTLTFEGQRTPALPYNASAPDVSSALEALSSVEGHDGGRVAVSGPVGGPFNVFFLDGLAEREVPLLEGDGSGLSPSGSVAVSEYQRGGVGYDTHYHFEYEPEVEGVAPFTQASSTAAVDVGTGDSPEVVAVDLPGLQAGRVYRYRVVASSTEPGDPVVDGEERALSVPAAAVPAPAQACPNEALRAGISASLPDCRAYEQLTPVDKEGSQEAFHYSGGTSSSALPGEDGDHLVLDDEAVSWGAGPGAGHSPYFFSRTSSGWQMTAAAVEPESGVEQLGVQVFDPDLTEFGFESKFVTSPTVESKTIAFRVGAPGGPYTTVAVVPRNQVGSNDAGLVAASADFSKVILQVTDRALVEPASSTKTGFDLYEYTGGQLRRVNVQSDGEAIGTCGASIVAPHDEAVSGISDPHAVSGDGSRVFFEAVPGSSCGAPAHLYMRVDGAKTVDLGAVLFLGADEAGSRLAVEDRATHQVEGYDTDTGVTRPASAAEIARASELAALGIPYHIDPDGALEHSRYEFFASKGLAGIPGGSSQQLDPVLSEQVYRYDSVENTIECVSCASPYDPEPRLGAYMYQSVAWSYANGSRPYNTGFSANGDYAFFSTPAALVPADVDGEVSPEPDPSAEKGEFSSSDTSPSSDIYEWRRDGLDGCVHVQGCIALITNGRGGFLTYFLGSAAEGRDVFFYTSSQLVPQDTDSAGDIYDARIDGGFPAPPPAPVECEGDACSNPASAPNDATPSSFTFAGAGNLAQQPQSPPAKAPKAKAKKKKKRAKRRRRGAKGRGRRLAGAPRRGVAGKGSTARRGGR